VIGDQRPRILHVPPRVSSAGQEAVELAASAGLQLDPWQQFALDMALGERADGKWAAFEVGLVVSRQNGKGSLLEARELAGLYILGEKLIIHSAHQFDTSLEAFQRILMLIEQTPDLDREVRRVSRSHGEEGIELKSGQRLRFRTRTKGGGRGFSADCIILDEAMYLGPAAIAALMPTMSARTDETPGGPQLWYTGSAGDQESIQLGRVRERALKGDDPRLCYLEWSVDSCTDFCDPELRDYRCPEHDPVDSEESYAKANPGLGIRISTEHVESERRSMDLPTFKQERLGIGDWPASDEAWRVISEGAWQARLNELAAPRNPLVFALDTSPALDYSTIAVAGLDGEGGLCVEITGEEQMDYRPGRKWVVPRVKELVKRWNPAAVIIDRAGQAGAFWDELERAGVPVEAPIAREYAQACGSFFTGVVPGPNNVPHIWHRDQDPLTAAVRGAEKRDLAGLWAWDRRNTAVDISPLVAATLAVWGHGKFSERKTNEVDFAWV
jgi:hypothetical protein